MTTVAKSAPAEDAELDSPDDGLPEGWVQTSLHDLLQAFESGSRPKGGVRGIATGIPSLGGEHLNSNGGFCFDNIKFVPDEFARLMNRGRITVGDILVVKDGATTGKVSLIRQDFPHPHAVINEHIFLCRPCAALIPSFIFHFLFSEVGQQRILEHFQGSAQGGINQSFAPATLVPLAPLAEQKRIVAAVEQVLARVNATKERLVRLPLILKRFRQSVLAAACSGRLTADWREQHPDVEPASELLKHILTERRARWEKEQLASFKSKGSPPKDSAWKAKYREPDNLDFTDSDLPDTWMNTDIGQLFLVDSGEAFKKKDYGNEGYRLFQIANVGFGETLWHQRHFIPSSFAEKYVALHLDVDEICIALNRPILGDSLKIARIKESDLPAVLYQRVGRLKAATDETVDYCFCYFLSKQMRDFVSERLQGSDQPYLNTSLVPGIPIPLPPLTEQQEIVRRVNALFKLADAIEERYRRATARVERITQAVLAKAFRGELVPSEAALARKENRPYEPASALLARISASRATAADKPKRATRKKKASHAAS